MSDPFDKLAATLSKLFELEKADLDFGIHRIIKARQRHIRVFLGLEEPPAGDPGAPTLKAIVRREMGELNVVELDRQIDTTAAKIKTDYGKLAFDAAGVLTAGPARESADGQLLLRLQEERDSGGDRSNAQLEAEIYSHLTEFFSRYYDEADFLSKRRIKGGAAPYAVPYSGEEVMLHWANKDQYYIKSSKDLKDYTFTLPDSLGGGRVQFKCERQDPVLNNNNAKREFHLDDEAAIEAGPDRLVIPFHFKIVDRTRTQPETKAWIAHLLERLPVEWQRALTQKPEGAVNDLITRHLANYTRKNEADFFIHKHLGRFLRGELDFYIKNEVMHLDDIDEKSTDYLATRVRLIKALRNIARHLITFLAQLENFQKKLWLKKKYVVETQWCITLDRIFAMGKDGEALVQTLLDHVDTPIRRYDGRMRSQKDEWIQLYAIDEAADWPKGGKLTADFLKAHDKLMLDTVFFPESFKWRLLGAIEDLDGAMDGLLVHSENFQALNLLQERYREKVKCVYIDPPYNTDASAITYKNGYKSSTWMALMQDRVDITPSLLKEDGVISVAIDDAQQRELNFCISNSFSGNILGTFCVRSNPSGRPTQSGYSVSHEYLIFAGKSHNSTIGRLPPTEDQSARFNQSDADGSFEWRNLRREGSNSDRIARPALYYPVYICGNKFRIPKMSWNEITRAWVVEDDPEVDEVVILPNNEEGEEKTWRWEWRKVNESAEDIAVREDRSGNPYLYYKRRPNELGVVSVSSWFDSKYSATEHGTAVLKKLFRTNSFSYPKSIFATIDALYLGGLNRKVEIALDYFAGSGTTGHAVINLNREDSGSRKYILVEMGDHFDTVLKPRIQKVVYSADWREGKPTSPETGVSHAFKYLRLESYEDALNNLGLGEDRTPDLLGLGDRVREEYLFSYLLDVETRGHLLNLDRFRDPWGCQLKIHDPHTGKSEARVVDLVETFHYLLGLTVPARSASATASSRSRAGVPRATPSSWSGGSWKVPATGPSPPTPI